MGSPVSTPPIVLRLPRLGPAAFAARISADFRDDDDIILRDRFEADFALTRLVAANCAATGDYAAKPTNFVIKGGFAIRHLYRSARYSKDADLAMVSDELEIEGRPEDLALPDDMAITGSPLGQAGESFKLGIEYRTSENRIARIQCDLNSVERPLFRRPPQRATLESLFVDPFRVWAATLEEIVGEKLFALIDRRAERIKDAYDVHHVLRDKSLKIDAGATLEVYEDWRRRKRKGPQFADLAREIFSICRMSTAEIEWERAVGDLVPRPDLEATTDELLGLLTRRLEVRPLRLPRWPGS